MTDDELSRLLDELEAAAINHSNGSDGYELGRARLDAARAAIIAHFDRRKSGEGGEDALPPIERDESYERDYIPLPGGWEVQTKGKGSTFRICDTKSGDRWPVLESHLHSYLERMAHEVRAAYAALSEGRGMAEKAIERYEPRTKLSAQVRGQIDAFMHPMEYGSWMRYDAELVRDAMRYRWLRDKSANSVNGPFVMSAEPGGYGWMKGRYIDDKIDTAISQSEGAKP